MGRPLNKKFTGDPTLATRTYPALVMSSAWISNAPAISTGTVYILKQHGTSTYIVTDGTYTGSVSLVGANVTAPGQATMLITPYFSATESGSTVVATYKVTSATVTPGHGGTGYNTGDTLTMTNGTVLTVASNAGNAVVTVNVTTPGSRGTVAGASSTTGISPTATSGAGTGAQFNLVFALNTITFTGTGTGYTAGENLVPTGFTATTMPAATISTVSAGNPTAANISNVGANITVSGHFVPAGSIAPTEYARVIKGHTVKTWAGNIYEWSPYGNITSGLATLNFAGAGSEANTYNTAYEGSIITGSAPYINPNASFVGNVTAETIASGGIPGGAGSQSQTSAVSAQTTGPTNRQSTQRKAPTSKIVESKDDANDKSETKDDVKVDTKDDTKDSPKAWKKGKVKKDDIDSNGK